MKKSIIATAVFLALSAPIANANLINESQEYLDNQTIEAGNRADNSSHGVVIQVNKGTTQKVSVPEGKKLTLNGDASGHSWNRLLGFQIDGIETGENKHPSGVTIQGDMDLNLNSTSQQIRAFSGSYATMDFNGNVNLTAESTGSYVEGINVWDGSQLNFNGSKTEFILKAGKDAVGVNLQYDSSIPNAPKGNIVNFNSAETILNLTAGGIGTVVRSQSADSKTIFNGKTILTVNAGANANGAYMDAGKVIFNKETIISINGQSAYVADMKGGSILTAKGKFTATATGDTKGVGLYLKESTATFEDSLTIASSGEDAYGIWGDLSGVTVHGNATVKVTGKGKNESTFGIRMQSDPGRTGATIAFNGESNTIDVSGTNGAVAIMASGGPDTKVLFNKGVVEIGAHSTDGVAEAVVSQYGGTVNFDADVLIYADGLTAYGMRSMTYGGQDTHAYGSIISNKNTSINVAADKAYGVAVSATSEGVDDVGTTDGVLLKGMSEINVVSNAKDGFAIGVYGNNEKKGGSAESNAKIVISDSSITAIGKNGALATGILGQHNAHIEAQGSLDVVATGKDSVGINLEQSDLTFAGTATVIGEKTGIALDETSKFKVDKNSQVATNNMTSTGTSTFGANSTLMIVGDDTTKSTLGKVVGDEFTMALGAGHYTIESLTGDNNKLVLSDMTNTEGVEIGKKTGTLTLIAPSNVNDQYTTVSDAASALSSKVQIGQDEAESNQIVVEDGAINNGLTATLNKDGSLSNINETKNNKLDAFSSVSALSALTLRHEMNSLTKRMGELRDAPAGVGAWVRGYGSEMEYGAQNIKAKNNSIQVGSDYTFGNWKVGAAFSYTDGESTYDKGSADNKNYGVAAYGTWFVPCGAYVDLMAKYNRLDNDFALNGMNGSFDNDAFTVSAETGYRFNFMDGGVFVEPQVGLSYGFIKGETIKTSNGVTLEQDDYNSLIGRVGVRTGFKFPKDKGTIYARISSVYDFDGEVNGKATLGQSKNTFEADLGGSWLEMGVGANFNWTKNTYTYIDFERANGGDVKENYRWNVGVRHNF